MNYKKMYVGGILMESKAKETQDVFSPVSEEVIGTVSFAGSDDVNTVVSASKKGFLYWRELSIKKRQEWMLKLRDALLSEKEDLIYLLMLETGKQRAVAEDDFDKLQSGLLFFPEAMSELKGELISDRDNEGEHKIVYTPVGPVVAFLAWNFPLLNLGYKIGPVLASGCSIIIKPSPLTPLASYHIGEICASINFPSGVINIVSGSNNEFGTGLSKNKDIAAITMIGSTPSALQVIKDSTTSIKRFSLELGGNAPFIVFDDADISKSIDILSTLKTANTGQICVSPNRVLLQKEIAQDFIKKLVKRFEQVVLSDPLKDANVMGPLISRKEYNRVCEYVKVAVEHGAKKIYGDEHAVPAKGFFYPPTILINCKQDNPAFREESFGPIVVITEFDTEEEAIDLANDTHAGLASYVFSQDESLLQRVSMALDFGEVMINGCKWDIYLPHIGIKDSGYGVDCAQYALHDYLNIKRITTMY